MRTLTFKQLQVKRVKELTHVDHTKIYGERLTEPILGHYYKPSERTTHFHEFKFDTSFPYVSTDVTEKNGASQSKIEFWGLGKIRVQLFFWPIRVKTKKSIRSIFVDIREFA